MAQIEQIVGAKLSIRLHVIMTLEIPPPGGTEPFIGRYGFRAAACGIAKPNPGPQPVYIRQIERREGELVNKESFTFHDVYNHLNK